MKFRFVIGIIFLILVIIGILFYNHRQIVKEGFDESSDINYYVITLKHEDRMENIRKQQEKIPENHIEIIDAVLGDDLDLNELVKSEQLSPKFLEETKKRHREIGCYMSHLKIYNLISERLKENTTSNYSVIFEDDFDLTEDFQEKLKESITVIENMPDSDFDLLYLGNTYNITGTHIDKNIYKNSIDEVSPLYGMHGYLINHKNIEKIIENTNFIDRPIDVLIDDFSRDEKLNVFVIHPSIVNQVGDNLPSTICLEGFSFR